MNYDKEYFLRKLAESGKLFEGFSESVKKKYLETAEIMLAKARSESLANLPLGSEYFFFYGSDSPFSQWYKSSFYVEGIHFACAEQYMMYKKALLFDDKSVASAIISTGYDPGKNKEQGRQVKGFNSSKWDREKESIVWDGNYHKFFQNKEILKSLLETLPKILVEASPFDTVWGIGLSLDNPRRFHQHQWRGSNLLGYTLTSLRDEFTKSEYDF